MSINLRVGDRVKIRTDINRNSRVTFGFNPTMEKYRGQYVTIANVYPLNNKHKIYEDGKTFSWHPDMFDLSSVVKREEVKFERLLPEAVYRAYQLTGLKCSFSSHAMISRSNVITSASPFVAVADFLTGKDPRNASSLVKIIYKIWPGNYIEDFMLGWSSSPRNENTNIEYYRDGKKASEFIIREFGISVWI